MKCKNDFETNGLTLIVLLVHVKSENKLHVVFRLFLSFVLLLLVSCPWMNLSVLLHLCGLHLPSHTGSSLKLNSTFYCRNKEARVPHCGLSASHNLQ